MSGQIGIEDNARIILGVYRQTLEGSFPWDGSIAFQEWANKDNSLLFLLE